MKVTCIGSTLGLYKFRTPEGSMIGVPKDYNTIFINISKVVTGEKYDLNFKFGHVLMFRITSSITRKIIDTGDNLDLNNVIIKKWYLSTERR